MYYADLGKGIGSEQEGYRPVLIIQNNTGNRHSTTVIVASISSKVDVKPKLPTHYFIDAECGLQLPSIVLLEQLRTVSKQRLEGDIEKGARFIAVNDNVDTINNTSSMDITPFKHILNDMYAKDISTK